MAGFKLELKGLQEVIDELNTEGIEQDISDELTAFAYDVERDAKQLAPVDEGYLRNSIAAVPGHLRVEVVVNCDYAAYLEFGTRKFAASYVASLPQDWRTFAATFKGPAGGGDVWEFIRRLMEWVRRKGLAGTYSVKTRKRTGKKVDFNNENFDAAFGIVLYILKNGIKAQPYLYPAFERNRPKLLERLRALLKK